MSRLLAFMENNPILTLFLVWAFFSGTAEIIAAFRGTVAK